MRPASLVGIETAWQLLQVWTIYGCGLVAHITTSSAWILD